MSTFHDMDQNTCQMRMQSLQDVLLDKDISMHDVQSFVEKLKRPTIMAVLRQFTSLTRAEVVSFMNTLVQHDILQRRGKR